MGSIHSRLTNAPRFGQHVQAKLPERSTTMKIGILQTGRVNEALAPVHGEYPQMFARFFAGRGFDFETWPVLDGIVPERPNLAEGWLITGSRFGAYEDHPWIPPLESFVRVTYRSGVPMIGICFGHQIIAQALGGKVEKADTGWSTGRVEYRIEGEDRPLSILAWHQDQVVEPPADARVIGSSRECPIAMLDYRGRALTLQPHPEFDSGYVNGLIDTVGQRTLDVHQRRRARSSLHHDLDSGRIADILAGFLRTRARPGESGIKPRPT